VRSSSTRSSETSCSSLNGAVRTLYVDGTAPIVKGGIPTVDQLPGSMSASASLLEALRLGRPRFLARGRGRPRFFIHTTEREPHGKDRSAGREATQAGCQAAGTAEAE
jgi:hypothetical protein